MKASLTQRIGQVRTGGFYGENREVADQSRAGDWMQRARSERDPLRVTRDAVQAGRADALLPVGAKARAAPRGIELPVQTIHVLGIVPALRAVAVEVGYEQCPHAPDFRGEDPFPGRTLSPDPQQVQVRAERDVQV